ncbi:ligase-associated DNA damage response endonuclease PdeM [uncultured Winogradskyella sp.]|uniref:ligase-associated DNA damage response endonuclease PdeM n=1 Tax=uncultured Winogradskyella sp. TaxID=395353 RepID=UPI003513E128
MNLVTEDITIANEWLTLTNQRAVYWPAEKALILSDLHIGKTAHFRKHGIPVPDDILQKDLERLEQLICHFKVQQLIIVGDLFHAENNSNILTFEAWLSQFENLHIILIKGNHDRQSNRLINQLGITVKSQLFIEPFNFIHEPKNNTLHEFTISGHIHPGVVIKGKGKQKLKLPCYHVTEQQLVLPAFSLFTGLNTNYNSVNAQQYVFTETSIVRL